jgi:hypothetical protein
VKGVADKRSAFARVDLRALDRIDYHVAQRDVVGVRNVYVTLCRVATLEMDGRHEGFDATRRVLMAKGSISRNTLDKHIAILESWSRSSAAPPATAATCPTATYSSTHPTRPRRPPLTPPQRLAPPPTNAPPQPLGDAQRAVNRWPPYARVPMQ